MNKTAIKVSTLAMALALAGGCATTEQINEIRSIAEEARATANSASSSANSALSTANEALDAARRAQAAADSATECCNANTSKIDRMFEKAMKK